MRPASKRLITILISLALLIGAVILFSSLIVPEYGEIQQLRGEKKSLDAVVEEEERLVDIATQLLAQYQSAAELRNSLSLVLPQDEALPGTINQIQGIAKSAGVTVAGINVEPLPLDYARASSIVEPAGGFRATVRVIGSYEALKSYLQLLETNIRIIDVDSITISGGGGKGPLTTSLIIKTYYQR